MKWSCGKQKTRDIKENSVQKQREKQTNKPMKRSCGKQKTRDIEENSVEKQREKCRGWVFGRGCYLGVEIAALLGT